MLHGDGCNGGHVGANRRAICCFKFVALVLALANPAMAQYGSTNYSIERWSEDYSYFKDAPHSTDPLDAIKYVPLGSDPDWYLSFGGQARYRFDYFRDSGFGSGPQDDTGFDLVRLLAHVDAHLGKNFRLFVQLNSGLAFDRLGGPRPGDADDFDVQQAFADVMLPLTDSGSLTVRVGRQELIYGAQRLVSPNDWGNVRRSFEGVKASISVPNDTVDLFLVRPVSIEKTRFNSGDDRTAFAGIYNVAEFPRILPGSKARLDTYLFLLDRSKSTTTNVAASSDTFTLGIRPHANPGPWDFDLEADWQFGNYDDHAIAAYSIAAEAGYMFRNVMFSPRMGVGVDLASGSANPAHRFDQLFPPQYLFLGHLYLLGRENIIDLHPELTLNLTDDITCDVAGHFFWRQNAGDAIYNLTGGVVRAAAGSRSLVIGRELDISVNWQISQHFSTYAGYAHFFTGSFLRKTGSSDDQDFVYASVAFTF
ncbi:MAG TPA: alginate export family protein [Tepidisphaeraceae bacterium]|jgi:hypothetical protein